MRIGFYNPYLAALGGGEKYFLSILEEASKVMPAARLTVFAPERPNPDGWRRLNIDMSARSFEWIGADDAVVTDLSGDLDLLVTMSNDVPVLNRARRAVAMIQFPLRGRNTPPERARAALLGLLGRQRASNALRSYDLFLCNSQFTRRHILLRLGVDAVVLAPPVDPPMIASLPKEPKILAVGRFHQVAHHKHQEILVSAFVELQARCPASRDWELHLVGGADTSPSTQQLLARLRQLAAGAPVHLHVNADRDTLAHLLAVARLFWHAAGYREDPRRHPERLEHFGIAAAEAMLTGVVPLVVPEGGQAEVVTSDVGRHWQTIEELVTNTCELIEHPERAEPLRRAARERARQYGRERFGREIREAVFDPSRADTAR